MSAAERITVGAACLITGKSKRTMQALSAAGKVPGAAKGPSGWEYDEAELRAHVAAAEAANRPCLHHVEVSAISRPTLIYFIQAASGHIKIGQASNVAERLSNLQCAHVEPLALLAWFEGFGEHERYLHDYFAAERVRREWFNPSARLLNYVRSVSQGAP